jgi:hypothetical protein
MRRLANIGYTLAIDVDPLSLVGNFNRAHLSIARGQCHNALMDIKVVQRHKNTPYLHDLHAYAKRFQWALLVTCKDLMNGIGVLPHADKLSYDEPVRV